MQKIGELRMLLDIAMLLGNKDGAADIRLQRCARNDDSDGHKLRMTP